MSPRFTYLVFNALLIPFYPLLAGYLLWRRCIQGKSAESIRGQLGIVSTKSINLLQGNQLQSERSSSAPAASAPVIWLHAVSVGEQMAARPLARALKEKLPGCKIALSVTTDTGFQTAQSTFEAGDADALLYFPLDLPFTVSRALKAVRPDLFITMETELWPNFLHLARAQKVLCVLANGRVSDNLLRRASRTGWLWKWMLSRLNGLLMRSEFDAQRMLEIIHSFEKKTEAAQFVRPRVLAVGDVKLDGLQSLSAAQTLRLQWREEFGIEESELLWVCGSTHPGEEAIALETFQKLRGKIPQLKLLLAPRHIERIGEVEALVQARNLSFARRSELSASKGSARVLLLDTVGELADVYAAADIAFVGGSLIPRGGHNLLEPLLKGVPVLFGPHTANFRAHAELIQMAGLGDRVQDGRALAEKVVLWLQDNARRRALPAQIMAALEPHQGAPERIASWVAAELKTSRAEEEKLGGARGL